MPEHKPKFSIVIPAYNYSKTLPRALESAIHQEGDDYEVLVVNDGSTDNTEAVIGELHEKYPGQFRSCTRENSGLAATRNYGIDHTSGEWLIFLDSDDEFEPGALLHLRTAIEANASAKMVVGGHMSVAEDSSSKYRGIAAEQNKKLDSEALFTGYLLHKSVTPSNGATAMHRDIFSKIRYPEGYRNSEDIPIFAYVFANFPCVFVEQAINKVYKHADSLRHNITYAHAVGADLIKSVFDPLYISGYLQKYRKAFAAQRYLSLFRTLYMSGERKEALSYYMMAIKNHWSVIFKLSYTRKAIKCVLSK